MPSVSDSYLTRTWLMWTTFMHRCPPKTTAYDTSQIWNQFKVRSPHSPLRRHTFHLSIACSALKQATKLPQNHINITTWLSRLNSWRSRIPKHPLWQGAQCWLPAGCLTHFRCVCVRTWQKKNCCAKLYCVNQWLKLFWALLKLEHSDFLNIPPLSRAFKGNMHITCPQSETAINKLRPNTIYIIISLHRARFIQP